MDEMKITDALTIPEHELNFETSRSGGPGGQHANVTSSRVTIRWNVASSTALSDEQRELLLQRLASKLTETGELLVHAATSRSQHENKLLAGERLAGLVRRALVVPKKRRPTKVPMRVRARLRESKSLRSKLKQSRRGQFE